jgi:ubiquitin-conjugating enzyme/von Willebrand factor type A domain-containing protein
LRNLTNPVKQTNESSDSIFIRWITAGKAIDYRTLDDIPKDEVPLPAKTNITSLKSIAMDRVYLSSTATEAPLKSNCKVELFLQSCGLRTTDEENTTLRDLGCSGTQSSPLNMFVLPMIDKFTDAESPHDIWPFETSQRGLATFITCLKEFTFMSSENTMSNGAHRRLLRTVFDITHFPPALEALQALREYNQLQPRAVLILVTCFRELALRMIPGSFIDNNSDQVLQGSRQIFAWVESEVKKREGDADDPENPLVRSITLTELNKRPDQMPWEAGRKYQIVEIDASGDAEESSSSNHPRCTRIVSARTHITCKEDVRVIALALWGYYSATENFYVDFRGVIKDPLRHIRASRPVHREFPSLLKMANESPCFKMVSPQDLDETFETTAITLSKDGFVSQFGIGISRNEFKGSEVQRHLWNIVSGTTIFDSAPGAEIHINLKRLIDERKSNGTWDLDDWESTVVDEKPDLKAPQEAIVICIDVSKSMDDPMGFSWIGAENDLTKLDETKQVFANVIARMIGYQLNRNFIGVVTFSTMVKRVHELSRINKQEFHGMVGELKAEGMTALWDSLVVAKEMLVDFKTKHPSTKLRIIALTDGADNASNGTPNEVCQYLYDSQIVLDSIVIGSTKTKHLFKISKHTGGYAFKPSSRLLLFQTFLLEPFLDISVRPDVVRIPITNYNESAPKAQDMETTLDFPPCRRNPLESGTFFSLRRSKHYFSSRSSPLVQRRPVPGYLSVGTSLPYRRASTATSFDSNVSSVSSSRVYINEMTHMANHLPGDIDVYVSEADMSFWKVVLMGPAETPYSGGTFVLTVQLCSNFPQFPPTVRFSTPILHPNITKVSHYAPSST